MPTRAARSQRRRPTSVSVMAWLSIALGVAGIVVAVWTGTVVPTAVVQPLPFMGMSLIGAVIARRRPGHAVGWLLVAIGLGMQANALGERYAHAVYVAGRAWPAAPFAAWVGAWLWAPTTMLIGILFVVFPTGRPLSHLWRSATWGMWALIAATIVAGLSLLPQAGPDMFHADSVADLTGGSAVAALLNLGNAAVMLVGSVAAAARFHRSRGVERQQMKWLAASALSYVAMVAVAMAVPGEPMDHPLYRAMLMLSFLAVPSAMAAAILRHGLYEIDRIIRRTITYTVLSAVLAGIYLGGVLLLGRTIGLLSADGTGDLAVAGSTLMAAAAFHPLRRRVQAAVDRRFDRSRFDADRTISSLSQRLRDEIDLTSLTEEISDTVRSTLRPSAVALWMRTGPST